MNNSQPYFAIKHLPSGKYLCKDKIRKRVGVTHAAKHFLVQAIPHLYQTKNGANLALRWYLRGEFNEYYMTDWETGHDNTELRKTERPDRLAEEYQVVEMTLKEEEA